MSDFKIFLEYLKNGDMVSVTSSLRPDFLERRGDNQMRPIHYASCYGHVDIVRFLIEHKCDIECKNNAGWRPIHYACRNGHVNIAKLLFELKCDIECKDDAGWGPIHHGFRNGHVDIVKFLIEHSCDIECKDNAEWRPIHYACHNGYADIVKLLFERNCDIECKNNAGWRPIHYACRNGHMGITTFLIDHKCDIECKDDAGWRPIHYACRNGHVDIAKFLIELNCDFECKDNAGWRPIHYACLNGHLDIAKFLIKNNCEIECSDDWGWRPIHYACRNGHVDIVKFLIERNCDIECKNNAGWRPIHHASRYGQIFIVKQLASNRCELQCTIGVGETPLKLAMQYKHQACEDFLTEAVELAQFFECIRNNECSITEGLKTVDVVTRQEQRTGLSFLEVVLEANATKVLKYFLDKRIEDEEIAQIKGYFENCSRPAAVELMQEFFLYRSIRYHHADGFELSCLASVINGHRNIVLTSFVELAAEHGASAFITEILKKSIYNKEEWTRAKNLAILKCHNKIVDAILDREILLTSRTKANFSSFHNAICDNDPDLMRYIFDKGLADPNFNNEVVGTCLSLAHMLCHAKCIETLQQFNIDVNTQNKYSQSPLHEAISSGMTDHCSYLINQARDIDKPGFMGLSGLQCAVMEGWENLCDELLKNGADCMRYVEDLNESNFKDTALSISKRENAVTLCIKRHKTIFPCFLEVLDSNKVNCCDGNEDTLLHLAVKALQPDLCKTLINCGANNESTNTRGNPPLFELFSHSDDKIVNDNLDKIIAIFNILIDSDADINKKSLSGITVFESASQCNSEKLMLCLLSKHPDLKLATENDLKQAVTNAWFAYAKHLVHQMPEDSLKSFISTEIFYLSMPHAELNLLKSIFIKASSGVQQSIIEDLLQHFSNKDEYDGFLKILETKINEPKVFTNGETLFTGLLKDKNVKYCLAIIRHSANRKLLNLANVSNQIPLQIAIDRELYDLVFPLIFECDQLNHEDIDGNTPLIQLFQKLSNSTDSSADEKLMTAVKVIISNGGDIFKKTLTGIKVIDCCSRLPLRTEIEAFQITKRNRDSQMFGESSARNICNICLDREFECVFERSHTL